MKVRKRKDREDIERDLEVKLGNKDIFQVYVFKKLLHGEVRGAKHPTSQTRK